MKRFLFAVGNALVSYIVAVEFGTWCGTATFLMGVLIYKRSFNE